MDGRNLTRRGRQARLVLRSARGAPAEMGRPHAGITAFIVPANTHGVSFGPSEEKMGLLASDTSGMVLDDARVDADAVLGEVGRGFGIALGGLDGGRIGIAAQSIGVARAVTDRAM